jgi:hypothetical protein
MNARRALQALLVLAACALDSRGPSIEKILVLETVKAGRSIYQRRD